MAFNSMASGERTPCGKTLRLTENNTLLHAEIAAAGFKAYAFILLILVAFQPGFVAEAIDFNTTVCACVTGLIVGASLAFIMTRGNSNRLPMRRVTESIMLSLAAASLIMHIVFPRPQSPMIPIALGLVCASLPFAALSFIDLISECHQNSLPRKTILVFLAIDIALIIAHFFQNVGLLFGAVALAFASATVMRSRQNENIDEHALEAANNGAEVAENMEVSPSTQKPVSPLPAMGLLLALFTLSMNMQGIPISSIRPISQLVYAGLLAAISLGLISLFKQKDSPFVKYANAPFDLVLLCATTIAFVIKMIPLEITATTLFPCCMEACFLLLAIPLVSSANSFTTSTIREKGAMCATLPLAMAAAICAGYGGALLGSNARSILIGTITAAFLIYAIVSMGHTFAPNVTKMTSSESVGRMASGANVLERLAKEGHLTPREQEVIIELAAGHSSGYIAELLFISSNTARSHMKNIYKKLGVHSREELLTRIKSEKNDTASLPR